MDVNLCGWIEECPGGGGNYYGMQVELCGRQMKIEEFIWMDVKLFGWIERWGYYILRMSNVCGWMDVNVYRWL